MKNKKCTRSGSARSHLTPLTRACRASPGSKQGRTGAPRGALPTSRRHRSLGVLSAGIGKKSYFSSTYTVTSTARITLSHRTAPQSW